MLLWRLLSVSQWHNQADADTSHKLTKSLPMHLPMRLPVQGELIINEDLNVYEITKASVEVRGGGLFVVAPGVMCVCVAWQV